MSKKQEDKLPPKILPCSDEWPSHLKRMKDLHQNDILLIRQDSKTEYKGLPAMKISEPHEEKMQVMTCGREFIECHISDLEVIDIDSLTFDLVEVKPYVYTFTNTCRILR